MNHVVAFEGGVFDGQHFVVAELSPRFRVPMTFPRQTDGGTDLLYTDYVLTCKEGAHVYVVYEHELEEG